MSSWAQSIIGTIGVIASLILYVVCSVNLDRGATVFAYSAYYFFLGILAAWAYLLYRSAKAIAFSPRTFLKENKTGIIASAVLVGLCFLTVDTRLRILVDESTLLSLSQNFLDFKFAGLKENGVWWNNEYTTIFPTIMPKRPLLFSFLLHLFHLVLGYQIANVYVLNAIVLFTILFGVYYLMSRLIGSVGAIATQVLILSHPMITLSATSGGFELFSIAFFIIVAYSLYYFLKHPSAESLLFLWFHCILLTHTRYESIAHSAVIGLVLVLSGQIKLGFIKKYWSAYALTPLFLFPYLIQRIIMNDFYKYPQGYTTSQGTRAPILFKTDNLTRHIEDFWTSLWKFGTEVPINTTLNLIGMIALALVCFKAFRKKAIFEEKSHRTLFLTVGACVLVNLAIILTYSSGTVYRTQALRYFCFISVFLALFPGFFLATVKRFHVGSVVALAALSFVLYHPMAMNEKNFDGIGESYKVDYIHKKLSKMERKKVLLITDLSVNYTIGKFNSVSTGYAKQNKDLINRWYGSRTYDPILVVQNRNAKTFDVLKRSEFDLEGLEGYGLRLVDSFADGERLITISRLEKTAEPTAPPQRSLSTEK